MISILCPSRGRPGVFATMVNSAYATARNPWGVEVVVYLDEDDKSKEHYPEPHVPDIRNPISISYVIGPRIMFSDMWNKCYPSSKGEIVMHAGDDQIFRTPFWDKMTEDAYAKCPDKILMVHGSDAGQHFSGFGAIVCLSRKWCDTVGYVTPPYFVGDKPDDWLNYVANTLGRRVYLPYVTEHMHPLFGKAPLDDTHRERRHREMLHPPQNQYDMMGPERAADVEKLRAVMDSNWRWS